MAFLLGNESCIEGLRSDLTDIQETIDEILVRTGPLKCYSWKSPDKQASELKIAELMERYKFGKDEVDNQVAHYSLLELIIDRLLLFTLMLTNHADSALSSTELGATNSKITRLNAGLVVKKFSNKFNHVCTTLRQLNSQSKASNMKQRADDSVRSSFNGSEKSKTTTRRGPSTNEPPTISAESHTKSVQTNETAFVPCESCAKVQANLKQNADQLINICHYQNLPSQVGKYRSSLNGSQLTGGWLNGPDMDKWLAEQDKDLAKIGKHLEFVSKNNELLKVKLSESEAAGQKYVTLEKELKKTLKDEQELRTIQMKQYEKKIADQKAELQAKIASLETELGQLKAIKVNLEQKFESLKNLNDNNEKIIVELNETNKVLSEEVKIKNDQYDRLTKLEEQTPVLNKELECIRKELGDKTTELNVAREKLENIIRSEQSLKLKHEAALETIDKLTADSDALKKRTGYVDEEKKQLIDNIKNKENQLEGVQYENEILQNSINGLKAEVKKLKDNELLLLKYPDLYGPMEQLSNEQELDVYEDMVNQMNANRHRVNLLENLNRKLDHSMKKLKETRPQSNQNMNDSNQYYSNGHNNSNNNNYTQHDEPSFNNTQSGRANEQNFNASFNGTGQGGKNYRHSSTSGENANYFMKPPESSSRRSSISQDKPSSRPYPLYKLDSEMEEENRKQQQGYNSNGNGLVKSQSENKFWNHQDSFNATSTSRQQQLTVKSNSQERVNDLPPSSSMDHRYKMTPLATPTGVYNGSNGSNYVYAGETAPTQLNLNDNDDTEYDDDFLRDKHKSDANYLEQLNQIAHTSELRVDSAADYNVAKSRRTASTRDHASPFLYTPADSSRAASRASNFTAGGRASALRSTPPIPPADKNMEVVVGKGRRGVGSGFGNVTAAVGSARSNSANAVNAKTASSSPSTTSSRTALANAVTTKPPTNGHTNSSSTYSSGFKCDNCNKKYDNGKDLDIHKLYCC